MICVYDGRDQQRAGHGLGVIHPSECSITEETGGSYEMSVTLPLVREWAMMRRGNVIRAAGAPHRMSDREQDFRIYGVELADDGKSLTVRARHIFYDGRTAFVLQKVLAESAGVQDVLDAMAEASADVPYTMDVEAGEAAYTGSIDLVNWVNALLDPDAGIVAQARLRLERDRMTVRLRPEGGEDSGLTLRWGSNLTGLTRSESDDQVVTRLQPVGEDADGNPVYLPEEYIDSPRIGEYWQPLRSVWRVSGAKVGQKTRDADGNTVEMTLEDVHEMLRKAARERLASGCDLPVEKTSLVHVDMSRVGTDSAQWAAEHVCLYDWATIVHGAAGVCERVQVTGYAWDVLRQKYTSLEVGDAFRDRTDDAIVTAPQLRKEAAAANRRSLRAAELIDIEADEIRMQARKIELIAYDVKDLDSRTSSAELRLDGADGQLELLGTKVTEQGGKIGQVEIDLNAAKADLLLKAAQTTVDALGTDVSEVKVDLDAVKTAVTLTATKTEVDALSGRVTATEGELSVQSDKIYAAVGEINRLNGDLADVTGSTLWLTRNNITGVVGRISVGADGKLYIQEGSGLMVYENGAAYGLYHENNLTAGLLVEKLNDGSTAAVITADRLDLRAYVTATALEANYAKITDLDAVTASVSNLTSGLTTASVLRSSWLHSDNGVFTQLSADAITHNGALVSQRSITMGSVTSTGKALSTGGELDLQHSHAVTVNDDGMLQLGGVTAEGNGGNFNIAETQFYQDAVSAAASEVTLSTGSWTNGSITVSASNGKTTTVSMPKISLVPGTWTDANNIAVVPWHGAKQLDGTIMVDGSEVYTKGWEAVVINQSDIIRKEDSEDQYESSTHDTLITIRATATNGATKYRTFRVSGEKAYSAGKTDGAGGVTLSTGSWTNGSMTVSASNGATTTVSMPKISLVPGTWTDANNIAVVPWHGAKQLDGTIMVDGSEVYTKGWEAVVINQSDIIRKEDSEDQYESSTHDTLITIRATATNGATKYRTFRVSGEKAYSAGKTDGAGGVTLSAGSWSNGSLTVSASNGKTTTVSMPKISLVPGTWTDANTISVVPKHGTKVLDGTIMVDGSTVYKKGWNACLAACEATVQLYKLTQDLTATTLYYADGTAAGTGFARVVAVTDTYFIPDEK